MSAPDYRIGDRVRETKYPYIERLEKTEPQRGPLICKDCTHAESISRELLPCAFLKGKAP